MALRQLPAARGAGSPEFPGDRKVSPPPIARRRRAHPADNGHGTASRSCRGGIGDHTVAGASGQDDRDLLRYPPRI